MISEYILVLRPEGLFLTAKFFYFILFYLLKCESISVGQLFFSVFSFEKDFFKAPFL